MESPKVAYENGVVKLNPNIKTEASMMCDNIMDIVHPDDQHFVALVLNYCGTTIGKKHKEVMIGIYPVSHKETADIIFYTVYVSLPITTIVQCEHMLYLRAVSPARITRNISDENIFTGPTPYRRLEIMINSLKYMPQEIDMNLINIHVKHSTRLTLNYDTNNEDDQRGSTKRTRHNFEHDK